MLLDKPFLLSTDKAMLFVCDTNPWWCVIRVWEILMLCKNCGNN